jgi:hypothetical protein
VNERAAAEDHLRVIRSLMERATVYRAISAPTALVGGVSSIVCAAAFLLTRDRGSFFSLPISGAARQFIGVWVSVLAITLLANTFFIWRKARRERRAFFSSGLRLAIASALPAVIVAAVVTAMFWRSNESAEILPILVTVWVTCYGLALLATWSFAPPSLRILGSAFLLAGIGCLLFMGALFTGDPRPGLWMTMAVTFGVFHIVYGVATWPRNSSAE